MRPRRGWCDCVCGRRKSVKSQATVKDVAARAGVAVSTVHRALHGSGYVSPEARQRVLEAAAALNYRPNALAQSLRRQRSEMIGHIVHSIYPNPFFACVAAGVEERARAVNLATVTCNTHGSSDVERDYVDLLLRQRVSGIIFTCPLSEANVRHVQEEGVPVCVVERPRQLQEVDAVLADNRCGAREAVAYLLQLGHRAIAFIGGRPQDIVEVERFAGYCEALEQHGVLRRTELIRFPGLRREQGYNAMVELLALPEPPTAVFAASDMAALGALQALWERRLRVPDDLSLVGFDDTLAAAASPPLTTVVLPMWEMGAAAVDLLVQRASGRAATRAARRIVLPTRLIIRASCGPAPARAGVG